MHNTLKICQKNAPDKSFASVFRIAHKSYNYDGTSTLEVKCEMSWGIDEFEVIIPSDGVGYEMSDTGNTMAVYYPAPKRGQV